MADINFYSGEGTAVNNLSGSGLGWYGTGGYGTPVQVSEYADNCYITNSAGTASSSSAIKVDNCKYIDANTVEIAGEEQILLRALPNHLSTLEIRLTNSTGIKVQNPKLRIFDRVSIDNEAANTVVKVAVVVHPWLSQSPLGSGSLTWSTPNGSGSVVDIGAISSAAISPGSGGLSPQGANTVSTSHSWFFAISVMPVTIGSKLFATSFSAEFI